FLPGSTAGNCGKGSRRPSPSRMTGDGMLIPVNRRLFLKSAAGSMLALPMRGLVDFRPPATTINARQRNVLGNGITDDAAAINKLIEEISARGGGSLHFPPGTYPCRSTIHLKDNVHISLDLGAVIKAAPSGDFDKAEMNANDRYQDFGHNHWR